MQLSEEFESSTRTLMGDELFSMFIEALDDEPPVSLRLNRFKPSVVADGMKKSNVPWCNDGVYLTERPNFTFDPLFHAGVYYVQEAASMFVHHILKQYINEPVAVLDLCAAPGGKSTCALGALPSGSMLVANEPISKRAQILNENIIKFGCQDVVVTNNYPKDYRQTALQFDLILADVPCSGEGMFRKDAKAIDEWSALNVRKCRDLQRSIIEEIWGCLKPGGLLIYSTCTLNVHENEENIEWIVGELGAKIMPVDVRPEWNITGSLNGENSLPVYRFIPGKTQSEGLFVAVLRKDGEHRSTDFRKKLPAGLRKLKILGDDKLHHHSMALSIDPREREAYPAVEIDYGTAINYLRHEAIVLHAETPTGILVLTFKGVPIGFVKNLGSRANNLYPAEWRIKSTHVPPYNPIVNV